MQALNEELTEETLARILIVDDNRSIHRDFYKLLCPQEIEETSEEERILFGCSEQSSLQETSTQYDLHSAYQGEEALNDVKKAKEEGKPFALAFVDMLMPPGWDGIKTIKHLWEVDPDLQIVICSAYSEYSWQDIQDELKCVDNLLILKKPFEEIEIKQLAKTLTQKWILKNQLNYHIQNLEFMVAEKTIDLERELSLSAATIESTESGIVVIDKNNNIIKHNNNFLNLFKLRDSPILNENAENLFQRMSFVMDEPYQFIESMKLFEQSSEYQVSKEWKLKNGAFYEFSKKPQYLHGQIAGTVFCFRDITERKNLEEQILHQSTHDTLTGLPNRILLADRAKQAIAHSKRYNLFMGLLVIDIDHFKTINDSFGHDFGDLLLKEAAKRFSGCIRECDTIARTGADEFVLLFSAQSSIENIEFIAEKLVKAFSEPFQIKNKLLPSAINIGVSVYPKDGHDCVALLKNADVALYQAKEMGQNTISFFRPELSEHTMRLLEIESSIPLAIKNNEFFLNYQPIIDLKTKNVVCFEALVRWKSSKLGAIFPDTFIPLAEKSRDIIPLGEWILRTACQQLKDWHDEGFPTVRMAVNVSNIQVQHPHFMTMVKQVLKDTGVNPYCLEIEITESVISNNFFDLSNKMQQLKELGIGLVIDDFGTGYSNLGYLRCLPFDKIKIDKVFIDDILLKNNEHCIVESIINMSHKLGLTVVAEGVEKEEQVVYLNKHYGNLVQGYLFSKPIDPKTCMEFLRQHMGSMTDTAEHKKNQEPYDEQRGNEQKLKT